MSHPAVIRYHAPYALHVMCLNKTMGGKGGWCGPPSGKAVDEHDVHESQYRDDHSPKAMRCCGILQLGACCNTIRCGVLQVIALYLMVQLSVTREQK